MDLYEILLKSIQIANKNRIEQYTLYDKTKLLHFLKSESKIKVTSIHSPILQYYFTICCLSIIFDSKYIVAF